MGDAQAELLADITEAVHAIGTQVGNTTRLRLDVSQSFQQ